MDAKLQEIFVHAQKIANSMLDGEIELELGCEELKGIYVELNFPEALKEWSYLAEGHSDEYYDKTLIPGVTKYNHAKWVATVLAKATILAKGDF